MTIPKETLDAAAKALVDEAMRVHALPEDEQFETDNIHAEAQVGTDPLWISGRVDLIAERALTAALPYIREQIAREVENDRKDTLGSLPNLSDHGRRMYNLGSIHAARIVRGEQ